MKWSVCPWLTTIAATSSMPMCSCSRANVPVPASSQMFVPSWDTR